VSGWGGGDVKGKGGVLQKGGTGGLKRNLRIKTYVPQPIETRLKKIEKKGAFIELPHPKVNQNLRGRKKDGLEWTSHSVLHL